MKIRRVADFPSVDNDKQSFLLMSGIQICSGETIKELLRLSMN